MNGIHHGVAFRGDIGVHIAQEMQKEVLKNAKHLLKTALANVCHHFTKTARLP
jgi:hypothetical protein